MNATFTAIVNAIARTKALTSGYKLTPAQSYGLLQKCQLITEDFQCNSLWSVPLTMHC